MGNIVSKLEKDFDFGPDTQSTWNARLGRTVYRFPQELQVRFGNKGDNLTFQNIVGRNLKVNSTAVIEFSRH